jgi:hypothetical protein
VERVVASAGNDEFVAREFRVALPFQTEASEIRAVMDGVRSRWLDAELRGEGRDMGEFSISVGTIRQQCQIGDADGRGELLRRTCMGFIV